MSTPRKPIASSSSSTPRSRTLSTPRAGASLAPPPRSRTTSTRGASPSPGLAPPRPSPARAKSPARPSARPPSPPSEPKTPLSIRDAIALKRAEAKKAAVPKTPQNVKYEPGADDVPGKKEAEDDVELSRWSIRDSIERARSSGNLNLSSRALASIPNALFEIHLGVTPEPLTAAPTESEEALRAGKTAARGQTAWFEAVDLAVLKLRDNLLVQIQPELSLFGSLKTLDLRNNRLAALPDTMSDLVNLVSLDLSANLLTALPADIATLPFLTVLNVSANRLTTLPLTLPALPASSHASSASFFAPPSIARASNPLPSLRQLLAAGNNLAARDIPAAHLPPDLTTCDLGHNPLGDAGALVHALARLHRLRELRMEGADVADEAFEGVQGFAVLEVLDLGKTKATEKVAGVFGGRRVSWEDDGEEGCVRVVVGNRIRREKWEIEADRRARGRFGAVRNGSEPVPAPAPAPARTPAEPVKESWEIEAEQGLHTEAGRRRARAAAALSSSSTSSPPPRSSSSASQNTPPAPTLAQYYDSAHATLTLPRSLPRTHNRARSLAPLVSDGSDPTVPAPTLPLPLILTQPFSQALRVLVLTNRRLDPSFVLPPAPHPAPLLPALVELRLDGCGLGDMLAVAQDAARTEQPIFSVLAALFPTLTSLDLSDNKLTHVAGVRALLIPDPARRTPGLKALRVRGNRIGDVMGLEAVAQVLKSEGRVEGWRLEELDLRDNEMAKLPPVLGYLPLDVLLVEGNTFRVPARRVWEREGTKGLLTWLKDRVE